MGAGQGIQDSGAIMRQVLVTGANGFIGAALTRRLLRDGVAVRAMCRSPQKGASLAGLGAEVFAGDVLDQASLDRGAHGCDVVFHLAAVLGSAAYTYNINVLGTQNVTQAAQRAGIERLVHVSTVAVYGYEVSGPIHESHPLRPSRDDYYQQTKAAGERVVRQFAQQTGIPTTIVRPAFVYGPGSPFWSRQMYELCRVAMPLIGDGTAHAHPIFVEDLADLIFTLGTHPNAPDQAFNAAPDPAPTWAEYLGHYAHMAGNTRRIRVPVAALSAVAPLVSAVTRMAGNPFDLAGTLRFMGHDATFKMTLAAELLGWQARTSLAEGMAQTEDWLKQPRAVGQTAASRRSSVFTRR